MPIGLPQPAQVSLGLRDDILSHSVTKGDAMTVSAGGVVQFLMPLFMFPQYTLGLPPDLPPWWSYLRDAVQRSTIHHEGFWGSAIRIAATKAAAQSFKVDGDVPLRTQRTQEMMLQWGGTGFVPSQEQGVQDFLTTDNGEFHEIVRSSSAAGSRIIGLVHLDSWRCQRTGDPDIPVLFRDLHGALHELKYYQVIEMSDLPSPSAAWWGIGHCSAGDAFPYIYQMHVTQAYINEKLSGAGADKLSIVKGLSSKQIGTALRTAADEKEQQGLVFYKGAALTGVPGDQPLDVKEIQLRGLPENFDIDKRIDTALLSYANAIGLDPQDLKPLSHQGLSGGTQSAVLFEKSKGRWPARRDQKLVHLLNNWVVPDQTVFTFTERDMTDELKAAQVSLARAQARGQQITNGELNSLESRQLAVEQDDLPRDFLPTDEEVDEQLSDTDKPGGDSMQSQDPGTATPASTATPAASPAPATAAPNAKQGGSLAEQVAALLGTSSSQKQRWVLRRKDIFELESNYRDDLLGAVSSVFSGDRTGFSLGTFLRSLVRNGAETMYLEGMVDGGFDSTSEARKELTDQDEGDIQDWVDAQLAEVPDFAKAAEDTLNIADKDERRSAQQGIVNRARLWADAFGGIGQSGKMSALGNRMVTWQLGDSEVHCTSKAGKRGCTELAGVSHRMEWFTDKGYNPGAPGSATACGGFNCGCALVDRKTGEVLIGG